MADFLEDPEGFPHDQEIARLDRIDQIQLMTDWFEHNFADPVHEMPYNSSEGGYQYPFGGPYDASDQLQDRFSGFLEYSVIEEAVANVESDGTSEWAPSSGRIARIFESEYEPDLEQDPEDTGAAPGVDDDSRDYLVTETGEPIVDATGDRIYVDRVELPFDDGSSFEDGSLFAADHEPRPIYPDERSSRQEDALRVLQERVAALEAVLPDIAQLIPRSHNHPPELVELEQHALKVVHQTSVNIQTLNIEIGSELPSKEKVGLVARVLTKLGSAIENEIAKTVVAGVIGVGSLLGLSVPDWSQIAGAVGEVVSAIGNWMQFLV